MDYEDLDIQVIHHTDKAILCRLPEYEDEEVWIPFSVIEDNGEDLTIGYVGRIYVSEWWFTKNGL